MYKSTKKIETCLFNRKDQPGLAFGPLFTCKNWGNFTESFSPGQPESIRVTLQTGLTQLDYFVHVHINTAKGLPAAVIQPGLKSNPGSCKEALINDIQYGRTDTDQQWTKDLGRLQVELLTKTKWISFTLRPPRVCNTPNANMADHSVIARDELHESEASEASVFCFDNASPEKSCFVDGLVCYISLCLRIFGVKSSTGEREFFFSFPVCLWGEDRRSKGVHNRRANCKSLFATFQARIS